VSCHRASARPAASEGREPIATRRQNASARAADSDYGLSPGEKAAVGEFLRSHPELRMSTDADRASPRDPERDMGRLYGVYHPYFVRGDVNDDGILDFVLTFVPRQARSPRRFSVVVFAGRDRAEGGPEFETGVFVERDAALSRGDIAVDRDAVLVTPDVAEDNVRRYRWNPAERSFLLVDDSDDDGPGTPEVLET
jgi:hypothetical protein